MNRYQRQSTTNFFSVCTIVLLFSTVLAGNTAAANPRITGNPQTAIEVGELYRFKPTVQGLRAGKLKFSIKHKPRWLNFSKTTGELKGRPGNGAVGNYENISIRVTDGRDSATLASFSVRVGSEPGEPSGGGGSGGGSGGGTGGDTGGGSGASDGPGGSVEVGDQYRFKPRVSGFRSSRLRFSVRRKPSWLRFDEKTGVLRGRPKSRDIGPYDGIVVRATDGRKTSRIGPFSIEVVGAGGSGGDDPGPGGDDPVPGGGGNAAPTIAGTPPSAVLEGSLFDFRPNASDADGDSLTFDVNGLPTWASFNRNNGRLSGTPSGSDVGVHGDIVITVSDGQSSSALGPFDIEVNSRGDATVTLQWTPPTRNTDGSRLRDLAAYRVDWGPASGDFTNSVTVKNPGINTYVIDNLTPGRYKFAVVAVNASGVASGRSNVSRRTVN